MSTRRTARSRPPGTPAGSGSTAPGRSSRSRVSPPSMTAGAGARAAAGSAGGFGSEGAGTLITLRGLARLDDGGAVHRREELEGSADPALPATSWPASAAREEVVARAGEAALLDLIRIRQVR